MEQRRIAVIFEHDKLKRIEGDVVAAGAVKDETGPRPAAPTAAKPRPAGGTPAKPEEKKPEPGASPLAAPATLAPAVKAGELAPSGSR
jgi:hypothetical protein